MFRILGKMSIIRDLFAHFIQASGKLGADKALRDTVIARQSKLLPCHTGKKEIWCNGIKIGKKRIPTTATFRISTVYIRVNRSHH